MFYKFQSISLNDIISGTLIFEIFCLYVRLSNRQRIKLNWSQYTFERLIRSRDTGPILSQSQCLSFHFSKNTIVVVVISIQLQVVQRTPRLTTSIRSTYLERLQYFVTKILRFHEYKKLIDLIT